MTKTVKICGLKDHDAASHAVGAGANLLGSILVPGRARTIDHKSALQIAKTVQQTRKKKGSLTVPEIQAELGRSTFESESAYYEGLSELIIANGPFFVGVFRNQPIDEVLSTARALQLDFIQLHGSENKLDYLKEIDGEFGVILRYVVPAEIDAMKVHIPQFAAEKLVILPLLDSEAGGEGKVIDWSIVNDMTFGRFILAGGLTPDNLHLTSTISNLVGFDVSGGVEDSTGKKDLNKITEFIRIGRSI